MSYQAVLFYSFRNLKKKKMSRMADSYKKNIKKTKAISLMRLPMLFSENLEKARAKRLVRLSPLFQKETLIGGD